MMRTTTAAAANKENASFLRPSTSYEGFLGVISCGGGNRENLNDAICIHMDKFPLHLLPVGIALSLVSSSPTRSVTLILREE